MAAEVLSCGHASQLFEVDYLRDLPQVHLHFLTDAKEFESVGVGKVEICCHGCGASLLVTYDKSRTQRQHIELRNNFAKKHAKCPNKTYEGCCPNYRSSCAVLDVRRKT
jgi:hypothetical protein